MQFTALPPPIADGRPARSGRSVTYASVSPCCEASITVQALLPRCAGFLVLVLVGLLWGGTAPPAHAQWGVDAMVFTRVGVEDNVFKSPATLQQGDTILRRDSLIKRDAIYLFGGAVDIERRLGKRQELALDLDVTRQRYASFPNQNERSFDAELEYSYDAPGHLTFNMTLDRRWRRSVGTNVLGDELTRLFSYRHWEVTPELEWDVSDVASLSLDYRRRWRTYDTRDGLLPLSYDGDRVRLISWLRFRDAFRPQWVYLRANVRSKDYRDYLARDLDGRQEEAYATNTLRYISLRAKYNLDVTDKVSWQAGVLLRRRVDTFEGYYNYRYVRLGTGIAWQILPSTTIEADAKWRHYVYDEKSASAPDEPLRYNYVDVDLEVAHEMEPYLHLIASMETDQRFSNVDNVARRTRRSYTMHTVTAGLRLDVDRLYEDVR